MSSPDSKLFSAATDEWFTTTFAGPTTAQSQGWPAISSGANTLICAPTGSGKTLAAFMWGIDRIMAGDPRPPEQRTSIVYISPLRALAVDVDKNLRAPLRGIALAADRLGMQVTEPQVGVRTGDTPADARRKLVRRPPDILITTPESLYLMLTSRARETLLNVDAVIIDEIHAMVPTKRGAHLALTLERLDDICTRGLETDKGRLEGGGAPQRIGLSATQRPLDEVARFLGGQDDAGRPRPVTIVDAGIQKELDVEVIVPVDDMAELGKIVDEPVSGPAAAAPPRASIWPAIHPRLLELIESHTSTLVFVNARRLSERLADRLNALKLDRDLGEHGQFSPVSDGLLHDRTTGDSAVKDEDVLVRAHHGSLSRERRLIIEDDLKAGRLRGLVATSSLELGIDMGAVDLVIQVGSPGAVARGLQRIGRAGHQVGQASRGKIFPKHRLDLLESAVVVERMKAGLIEETRYLRNALDVLAQHIVAMCALDPWNVEDLARVVRRSASYAELSDEALTSVLDLLSGRYPSEEFSELRPRITWDRVAGEIRGRAGAQRLAVTNPGTIPDRGLFGVFLPDGTRVGELDEEMVYESRPGEVFILGASSWRIEEVTFDRVIVTPAPGQPARLPFWHGDGPGRPLELGRAIGQFTREVRESSGDALDVRLRQTCGLDERAASNLISFLEEQAEATGAVPDDRTIVVERFRDEIGDWRICVLSPFGARVHAPWAIAMRVSLEARLGLEVESMWSDDGMVFRLPDVLDVYDENDQSDVARVSRNGPATDAVIDALSLDPDELTEMVVAQLPSTSMFASRFRECAGRSLLLPRRRPDQRTPLWQQRQRSADLLAVASKHPQFPVLLETTRECLQDVFDLPALQSLLRDIRSRKVRIVPVETTRASPMAQSLLFGWIAIYMYEGDAPLAERRAAALSLDRDLLRELLGSEELRELIDPEVLADLELELQKLADGRQARDGDEVHDLIRMLGPLTREEIAARATVDTTDFVEELLATKRAIEVGVGGAARIADAADASRLRDALGVALPQGLPAAFTDSVRDPLGELVGRYARTHGPFLTGDVARRLGVPADRARFALEELETAGRLVRGEFRPGGAEREWCDAEVLRALRRRSLAALRREVEPVDAAALGRFLPAWQSVGRTRRGPDALLESIEQLQGAPIPVSVLEADVLSSRVGGYSASMLDSLCASGELVWVGAGSLGPSDGRVRLCLRDRAHLLLTDAPADEPPAGAVHDLLRGHLGARGASFWNDLLIAVAAEDGVHAAELDGDAILAALYDLVWAGEVTNDTLAPVRAYAQRTVSRRTSKRRRPPVGRLTRLGPPAAGGRWSLVRPLVEPAAPETEVALARASQLLERYGVVTREAVLAEGVEGGYAGVYGVLKALEDRGQVRRGYFVNGLGAAQFALPGAVDRLRSFRSELGDDEPRDIVVLAATDPAQPYGAALRWPETNGRPARAAGAFVVLCGGQLAAFLERGGKSLSTFEAAAADDAWIAGLQSLAKDGRLRSLDIRKIDGVDIIDSPEAERLRLAGFVDGFKGLVFQP